MKAHHHPACFALTCTFAFVCACSSTVDGTHQPVADSSVPADSQTPTTLADAATVDASDAAVADVPVDTAVPSRACGSDQGPCPAGWFCYFTPAEICSAGDAPGVCQPVPTTCPPITETDPTCACNGVTYDSPCLANMAGQGVLHAGACVPPDCHIVGCPAGTTCQECLGATGTTWVCMANGTTC